MKPDYENVFFDNAEAIRKIAQERKVTVDIAARIYVSDERLWEKMDSAKIYQDLNHWDTTCTDYIARNGVTLQNMWDDIKDGTIDIK